MLALGLAIIMIKTEYAMSLALACIGIGMTLRGFNSLYYYLTMAKNMVGGKLVLYWGIIYLELGLLSSTLSGHPSIFAIVYIAILLGFSGVVSILRANESRKAGGHWRLRLSYGAAEVLMTAAIIVSGAVYHETTAALYIYGAALIYSAALRMVSAFRRADIVYIQ